MVSTKIEEALNQQIGLEAYASFLYLSMASWCDVKGMEGCTKFMHRQSAEEREHMLRIFHYISEVDGHALVPAVDQAPPDFDSIQNMFQKVYEHEQKITNSINKIVSLCYEENDYSTLNFLQWYIEEQREEENLMRTILDRIKLIGDGPQSLYYVDKEIEKINEMEEKMEAAEESED
ncbi:MAG: ferritin [Bacteroidota bacterium]